ncbi:MAG: 50S ribosomal protein L22 [Nanoarchaeota archaeon]|nr:50S ribosomal protein L22 [Nanoarchaeota archaeon]MBU1321354.1 50S ribosomal protein L22 [Nanoarchaeota archaeon]MBU1597346.1 50S ribosomal protein L22 [Nanoarchaeota archaeon]MBU2441261.1 50S ribosomal protein L22 [Nanoarchaeota archaeon]
MKYNYAFKSDKENVVKIVGRDLGISTKQAIEICSFIKNKPISKTISILEKVIEKQIPIPFTRFTEGAGHKTGMASGKFPVKASKQFINLLKTLEANAQNKGLGTELKIIHACAQRASSPMRHGRKRGISMKRAHVEIMAEEMEPVKKDKKVKGTEKQKPEAPKEEKKVEVKKEVKPDVKPEVKQEEKNAYQPSPEISSVKKEASSKAAVPEKQSFSEVKQEDKK